MLVGMLLAICTYHFIFQQFLSMADPANRTELADQRKILEVKNIPLEKNLFESVRITTTELHYTDGAVFKEVRTDSISPHASMKTVISIQDKILPAADYWKYVGWIFILIIFVTMVYGPIAAFLVEMFPTRIRYTSMSLPYHIGNGWFGGFLPATVFAIQAATGDNYSGLWYPIGIALMTFVIGLVFLPETKDRDIFAYKGE
jgi:hypothetical protein